MYENVLRSLWVFKFEIGQLVICPARGYPLVN